MFSVIIPSRNIDNLVPCIEAVRQCEPDARIIVVDDGLPSVPRGVDVIDGIKPFCFSKNVNLGIAAAKGGWIFCTHPDFEKYSKKPADSLQLHETSFQLPDDDVVILGDDGLLQTPGGFSLLEREAEVHPEYGIISSTVNNVGNLNQLPKGIGLREDPRIVCFVAVYIPRRTIETVGLLDERFTGYGFDDDDFCLRIRRAGLKIGIHDGCFVDHNSLKSTFRGNPDAPANLVDGRAIFVEKWGAHPL